MTWPSRSWSISEREPWRMPGVPPASAAAWRPVAIPSPAASATARRTDGSPMNRDEQADRVRAAADAGERRGPAGGPRRPCICAAASSPMTRCRSRTIVGYGCGPIAEPEDVMGRRDVRDPVAHRLVDRVLERGAAARDRADLGAEGAHPQHVRRLARGCPRRPCRRRRAGPSSAQAVAVATPCWPAPVSAMTRDLPRRRVRSAWPEGVVDLVGAGVGEVLALEVEPESTAADVACAGPGRQVARPLERELGGQPVGPVERRRAAGVRRQQRRAARPRTAGPSRSSRQARSSCSSAAISVSGT